MMNSDDSPLSPDMDGTPAAVPVTTAVVYVPAAEMGEFRKRLAALNRKAVEAGLAEIRALSEKEVRYAYVPDYNPDGELRGYHLEPWSAVNPRHSLPVLLRKVELEYPIIKLGNWDVVAVVDAVKDGANLVFPLRNDPDVVAHAEKHRTSPVGCEHCGTKRRRTQSFLLRDPQGAFKEVGSTCLEAFTGIDPSKALFLARMYRAAEGGLDEALSRARPSMGTREFLIRVAHLVETVGFVSATSARDRGGVPTYRQAEFFQDTVRRLPGGWRAFEAAYDRHALLADAVIGWASTLNDRDGFEGNLHLLLSLPEMRMEPRCLAFAAAAIPAYRRAMEAAAREAAVPTSRHVGTPGEKRHAVLTVRGVFPFETIYGTQYRVNLEDVHGNKYSWKTGAGASVRALTETGDGPLVVSFKVKDHVEFRGEAITEISHLKCQRPAQAIEFSPEVEAALDAIGI